MASDETPPRRISVSEPALRGNERRYVNECLDTNWLSWNGRFVEAFETEFSRTHNGLHAVAVANGTVALHLILAALGIKAGDEVIVPSFTYVASVNAVTYTGATPVLVDCDPYTGNITAGIVVDALGPRTRAVLAVDMYGTPCDVEAIVAVCRPLGIHVIEDAAEALGAVLRGRRAGTSADAASFSFFANKTLTTGEGGMILTKDSDLAARCRLLRGHAMDSHRRWWFTEVGFNYRMTNLQAAIGLAQIEMIDWHVDQRRRVAGHYTKRLSGQLGDEVLTLPPTEEDATNSWWLYTIRLAPNCPATREGVIAELYRHGIETRETFIPMHLLPIYSQYGNLRDFPNSEAWGESGLSLPTHANLTQDDIDYVADRLIRALS